VTLSPRRNRRAGLTSDGCWVIGLSSSYDTIGSLAHALRLGADSDFHRTPTGTEREATIAPTLGAEMAGRWREAETMVRARPPGAARVMSGRRAERATDMVANWGRDCTMQMISSSWRRLRQRRRIGERRVVVIRIHRYGDAGWRAPEVSVTVGN
jgi:hypothetical protein